MLWGLDEGELMAGTEDLSVGTIDVQRFLAGAQAGLADSLYPAHLMNVVVSAWSHSRTRQLGPFRSADWDRFRALVEAAYMYNVVNEGLDL
eukprot:2448074-Amphidinium_carterae.1